MGRALMPLTEATKNLSPIKNRAAGQPIPVEPRPSMASRGSYPLLPHDLASDIQQFIESEFAKQYFSTHRTGFIFKRKVPVAQMMAWQKAPLTSPLLVLNRDLHKDAVKIFKVIERIMGDRDRDRPVGVRQAEQYSSTVSSINGQMSERERGGLLEEERWLLGEGLTHGELRDEIYCQVMKQLNKNPNPESVFKGWQLLCVLLITFPPSKNFETYLQSFIHQCTTQAEGRVDVMAKYCLRRLAYVSKKGPRGKPPSTSEIEVASDAAFNPSIFGESLDIIFRLQERTYPHAKVPIILPFLADGILALGGTKSEGIFRVPGDGDSVAELKLRLDQGYYTLEGVDDPHVLSSLFKLWLRELLDPLVPDEMYNDCITDAKDPEMCIDIVQRLPTANRRVVLFVISFLQLFLEDKVTSVTKMTSPNLALVMAPNLLRCSSESMSVVFTNAQYEQHFVHNLLLHLKCNTIDPDYVPQHGLGAISTAPPPPRMTKTRSRRS
ncbi:RhoGAP-domain-containing protein [Neolentinus lepideus HHB14362 ss-1]|uniref:RhoGAP-domain-containing protein n=1 Tax=Neolentinus lepideus HHB14362 ss-1 TaxID=1314782 RepID=A0A165M9M0_9AGAM|nr:RhoGAP-domain-containing protein [Neolentinus lepideus HHB14362 ss-1]